MDVLEKSVQTYYDSDPKLAQGDYPTLLHDAAIMGLPNLLRYLVAHDTHGVDYAYKGGPTPLGYIAGDNQLDAARILLKAGANPNSTGNMEGVFPLSSAVISGNMQMVRLLLDYKAKIHNGQYYQSPLGLALERNDLEILQIFDTYEFTLDSLDKELRRLLLEYLNSDFVEEEVLKILIRHGFDIYTKTMDTPSFFKQYAPQIQHIDVKKMLQDLYTTEALEANVKIAKTAEDVDPAPVSSEMATDKLAAEATVPETSATIKDGDSPSP
jgi:ankyrin repeat protein